MSSGQKYLPPNLRAKEVERQRLESLNAQAAKEEAQITPPNEDESPSSDKNKIQDGDSPSHGEKTAKDALTGRTFKDKFSKFWQLKVVEIDSLVIMKVMKHCRENYPTQVNGQLLGSDFKDKLEVTNCFPLPQKKEFTVQVQKEKNYSDKELEERVDEEFDKYQDRMAELMHDVNVDCFTVGWYQTLSHGDLKNKDNIDSLILYQELVDKSIMLGFDPLLHMMGKQPFKAYKINYEFYQHYHEMENDVSKYNKLRAKDILVEVPMIVKNPFLVEAFLLEHLAADPFQDTILYQSFNMDQTIYLEKNLNMLNTYIDTLQEEQDRLHRYFKDYLKQLQLQKQLIERRKLENEQRRLRGEGIQPLEFDGPAFRKLDPPSQLTTLLLANQVGIQAKELNGITSDSLAKIFLLYRGQMKKKYQQLPSATEKTT